MSERDLDIEYVKEILHYDANSGYFFYTRARGNRSKHSVAGNLTPHGYVIISVNHEGKKINVLAHRLAWRLVHGEWPEKEIDHINRKRSDNRINNLRRADDKLNGFNQDRVRKSGHYIWKRKIKTRNKYTVVVDRKMVGYYETLDMAEYARDMYLQSREIS